MKYQKKKTKKKKQLIIDNCILGNKSETCRGHRFCHTKNIYKVLSVCPSVCLSAPQGTCWLSTVVILCVKVRVMGQHLRSLDAEKMISAGWLTSTSRCIFSCQVKVIDESGCVVPIGERGEMCTRGYTTMLNYWNDPEKTQEVISEDRWYHTGYVREIVMLCF